MDSVISLEPQHHNYPDETFGPNSKRHSSISHDDKRVKVGLQRAHHIDLRMVRIKLVNTDEVTRINLDQIDEAIQHYREFLALLYAYPNSTIVPTKIVDAVWHHHILDTRAYATDTQWMFGSFLHHYPYFGMRSSDDAKQLATSFEETCALWKKHFGHSPSATSSPHSSMGGCGGGKCSSCKS